MKEYRKFDVGSMGEFDVALLIDQYEGVDVSKGLYPEWRGGYYYAALPRGDTTASLALVYVSRWASPESAAQFAAIYAKSLAKRYRHVREVADAGKNPVSNFEGLVTLTGNHEWLTEEGDVVIDAERDTVFVSESLDDVTSGKLRDAVMVRTQAAATGK
jgi:hypothetical protein